MSAVFYLSALLALGALGLAWVTPKIERQASAEAKRLGKTPIELFYPAAITRVFAGIYAIAAIGFLIVGVCS